MQVDGNVSFDSASFSEFSSNLDTDYANKIPVVNSNRSSTRLKNEPREQCLTRIRRSNKSLESVHLPVVINLNPRSLYNKVDEFKLLIEQTNCGICFISESWDRDSEGLQDVIEMENYRFIKNVLQRSNSGGKPALFVSTKEYHITELCPNVITVPPNVEAVWALLTPKSGGCKSKISSFAVCSFYFTKETQKSQFLDHISEAFHLISAKYGAGVQFILAGDSNRLNLKPILNLSQNLKQVVNVPTRRNPDAILDTIITTLEPYYHPPATLPPLDNDSTRKGKPSDHLIVYMKPITASEPKIRNTKTVTYRPFTDSGLQSFGKWIKEQNWETVFEATTAHEKAEILQTLLLENLNKFLPLKSHKISSEDQPWFTPKLKKLERQMKREYVKHKKSKKWTNLRGQYVELCSTEKSKYYQNIVEDLKFSNPGQWYSKLKRMSSHDQAKSDEPVVLSIAELPNQIQAELIADEFSAVSNLYEPLRKDDIIDERNEGRPFPNMTPYFVHQKIKQMKNGKSTVNGDIPIKIIKMFAYELSFPLSNIFVRCCKAGEYPNIWKLETVTPIPKRFPPEKPKHLRKISGTLNFSKLFEKFLAEAIITDMKPSIDPRQFGNQKGMSTQHYLIQLVHRILTALDRNNKNEAYAAILHLIDWQQAFDRQCPNLGINSFIMNGVRKSLIPVLTNYLQQRKMQVKWHGLLSSIRDMPGGGAQGCILGQIQYSSQSNDSGSCVSPQDRFKFVDDMSLLEILNLVIIGLEQYDFIEHVASDIADDSKFLSNSKCKSQDILNSVSEWTDQNKMKLNEQKCNYMVFNFTKKYQFSARFHINGTPLQNIQSTKLLGTIVSADLTWWQNTNLIVQNAHKRLLIIRKLYEFDVATNDLVHIYTMYVRSVLEFNCCVWHFSITEEEKHQIERVQKIALKLILKDKYTSYQQALQLTNLNTLEDRRAMLCRRFALKCVKNPRTASMFPLDHTRHKNKYKVTFAKNSRLLHSAIPQMQRILNS